MGKISAVYVEPQKATRKKVDCDKTPYDRRCLGPKSGGTSKAKMPGGGAWTKYVHTGPVHFMAQRRVDRVAAEQERMLAKERALALQQKLDRERKAERVKEKSRSAASWFKAQGGLVGGHTDFKFPMPRMY
tara:strand:+ start:5726 stop:6118 length:393 start_codon:yes stop_codon:yes gene_type:complete